MFVTKRSGKTEPVSFDKITKRIKHLTYGLDETFVDPISVSQKVVMGVYKGVKTSELDELAAETAANLATYHPDYSLLAGRITTSNLHKNTLDNYKEVIDLLYNYHFHGEHAPLVSKELYDIVNKYPNEIQDIFNYHNDYTYDYFAIKTLQRSYLLKIDGKIIERPQHLLMRVAIGIQGDNLEKIKQTYNYLTEKYYTHATPTLFNAGTTKPQCSSCFLLTNKGDSIEGIFDTLKDCATISKHAGGIGINIHNIRANGSYIKGTGGYSNGIVPMLQVFNNTARYVDQCITGDTIIYTTDGPKQIQHTEQGKTQIFTLEGPETIQNVLEHRYNGNMFCIRSTHSVKPLQITGEHPVYALRNTSNDNMNTLNIKLSKGLIKPEWIDAKDLRQNDLLTYTIPEYTYDMESITLEDCFIFGILVANGNANQETNTFSVTSSIEIIKIIEEYLRKRMIYFKSTENVIVWEKNNLLPFRYNTLFDVNGVKRIPITYMNLPLEKITEIMKGFLQSITKYADNFIYSINSLELLENIRYILLRMGIPSSGEVCKSALSISDKETYIIDIPITDKIFNLKYSNYEDKDSIIKESFDTDFKQTFLVHDKLVFSPITSIDTLEYKGTLYDLQMKDCHNYMIHNGVVHNGGGKRKGSIAVYLEPWHADIEDFLELKKNHGKEESRARDLFYALWIPDLFMQRVKENGKWSLMCPNQSPGLEDVYGDDFVKLYTKYEEEGKFKKVVNAQELFFKICESQLETGTPYMLYKDACNKKSNQKNLGTIKNSNLCVSPETMILTQDGYYPISSLKDKDVSVWNGKEWSKTTVKQTGKNQKLINVNFSNGMSIKCTPYHKFYIETGKSPSKKSVPEIVRATDLKSGMKIIRYNTGIVNDNKNDMFEPYTHGLFCADGTYGNISDKDPIKCSYKSLHKKSYCKRHIDLQKEDEISEDCQGISYSKKPIISLYGEKISLEEHISYRSKGNVTTQRGVDRINYTLPLNLDEKFYVPINNSLDSKIRWLEGYLDGDGCVVELDGIKNLQAVSVHKDFLKDIVYMLQTIGITSTFSLSRKKGKFNLPNGKGGLKYYDCNPTYRLNIDARGLMKLIDVGFSPKRLDISEARLPKRINNAYVKIVDVVDNEEYDDTYCFTEPKENKGIFEGVLTGQCTEILEYTSPDEQAVCNLASLNLSKYVVEGKFDFEKLGEVTEFVTDALNKVIDINYYPTPETKNSNMRHRPIGIGVQGLADVFMMLKLPFESEEAQQLNKDIFETIYYHALVSSNKLAMKEGSYSSFNGSPASMGELQFDLWGKMPTSDRYKWGELKGSIMTKGLRNSLLVAPMPTASTSQILGNNESFEPYTSNVYSRRTLSGDFPIVNKHLIKDLIDAGLWNKDLRNLIMMHKGSVQYIPFVPDNIKNIYKTVWEISQKNLVNMAADRGLYIDQSQSFNVHMEDASIKKLSAYHFYSWSLGVKTGLYYLRTKAAVDPIAFTVDTKNKNFLIDIPVQDGVDACFNCGS